MSYTFLLRSENTSRVSFETEQSPDRDDRTRTIDTSPFDCTQDVDVLNLRQLLESLGLRLRRGLNSESTLESGHTMELIV